MNYYGGKARLAERIAGVLKPLREPFQVYWEPFCGHFHVGSLMDGRRIGSDTHFDLIDLLREVRSNNFPCPGPVSRETYYALKTQPPSLLRTFVGFHCSYYGKWWDGYNARHSSVQSGWRSLMKLDLHHMYLSSLDYREMNVGEKCLIYCDPPYKNTKKVHNRGFDHDTFWPWAADMSARHTVIVSELSAPAGWTSIAEWQLIQHSGRTPRIERLWRLR